MLRLLVDKLDYFSDLFPALATAGETTEEAAVALLAEAREDEIKPYHVRCRLKWLAGLGLGSLKGIRLLLSKEGQAQINEIAREAEIQDRDRHEEEADKRSQYFSVREITDVSKFVDAAARLGPARRAALVRVQKRFISYPFSTIDVLEQPIDTACEIFERINNSGKILNVVDLMVAKTWSPAFNLRDRLNEFREELAKAHYDDVPDITILQCVAGILTRAVRRKNILDIDKTQIQKKLERDAREHPPSDRLPEGRSEDYTREDPPLQLSRRAPDILLPCGWHPGAVGPSEEDTRSMVLEGVGK